MTATQCSAGEAPSCKTGCHRLVRQHNRHNPRSARQKQEQTIQELSGLLMNTR